MARTITYQELYLAWEAMKRVERRWNAYREEGATTMPMDALALATHGEPDLYVHRGDGSGTMWIGTAPRLGDPEIHIGIEALTPGRAKAEAWKVIRESFPQVRFVDVRVRRRR